MLLRLFRQPYLSLFGRLLRSHASKQNADLIEIAGHMKTRIERLRGAVKYKLSGPGLNTRRKLDKTKDNNMGININKLKQYKFNYFCIIVFANNLI